MDARFLHRIITLLLISTAGIIQAATYETANFAATASTASLAKQSAELAEQYRKDMALLWLGAELPAWSAKCPIKIHSGDDFGAGGATSFVFENGEVFGWEMEIQGSEQRILDSVLPHEITHMVLASHFRRPIPRWLDEGMATSVEHAAEKEKYRQMLRKFLRPEVRKCFPLNQMAALKEYPSDPMPFYAQGFSLTEYLLERGRNLDGSAHRRLVQFTETALDTSDWHAALQKHYAVNTLGDLQTDWLAWLNAEPAAFPTQTLQAANEAALPAPETNIAVMSAKPLPPYGKSVYDRRTVIR